MAILLEIWIPRSMPRNKQQNQTLPPRGL